MNKRGIVTRARLEHIFFAAAARDQRGAGRSPGVGGPRRHQGGDRRIAPRPAGEAVGG